MELFGGKWKTRIICVLSMKKKLRYGELKKELTDITDTVLASTLKELSDSNMVIRQQYNEIPPRVEYSLSAKGESVLPVLMEICKWTGAYCRDSLETNCICKNCDYIMDRSCD